MASLRTATRFLSQTSRQFGRIEARRGISSKKAGAGYAAVRPVLLGAAGLGAAYGIYKTYQSRSVLTESAVLPVAYAASIPDSQPSVFSGTKSHALYLWIHLKPTANAKQCAKVVGNLQAHIDVVCPPDLRDEDDEVIGGVGFGPEFWYKVYGKTKKNYQCAYRSGSNGDMPSSGGDIFIHAKSNDISKLFELGQRVLAQFPEGSVDRFEDIYGWVYRNGRDLSGFIDGTENPADDEHRQQVAVEKGTGGSYVITQKWIHRLDVIAKESDKTMEGYVGRAREDSTELKKKPITSHVARMTGGSNFEQKKAFEIVRQSQPFGTLSKEAGLFFIGYSESPENLDYMLDRMVGKGTDGNSDDIMKLTTCVKGTYWYFPGVKELKYVS